MRFDCAMRNLECSSKLLEWRTEEDNTEEENLDGLLRDLDEAVKHVSRSSEHSVSLLRR
jgi:hypothetical protein